MSVADDVREIFDKMPEAFIPERAAGMDATIQLHLTGEGGGDWIMEVANGQISINEGQTPSPDMTLTMDAADYVALSRGQANPMSLFQAGKIRVQGNMTLALKFQEMFARK
jgi:putative sterol carrier protein